MTQPDTLPAVLLRLAALEKDCSECGGTGWVEERAYPPGQAKTTCSQCGGKGRVPLLDPALMWEPCVEVHVERLGPTDYEALPCEAYGCPGWHLNPDAALNLPEALVRAGYGYLQGGVRQGAFFAEVWRVLDTDVLGLVLTTTQQEISEGRKKFYAEADNPVLALALAAEKALTKH